MKLKAFFPGLINRYIGMFFLFSVKQILTPSHVSPVIKNIPRCMKITTSMCTSAQGKDLCLGLVKHNRLHFLLLICIQLIWLCLRFLAVCILIVFLLLRFGCRERRGVTFRGNGGYSGWGREWVYSWEEISDGRVEGARIEPGIYPAAKKKKIQTDACKKTGHVTKAHSRFC